MLMLSSTVTNCGPLAWISTSDRPRQGRMRAVRPVIRCERLSFVEMCAVSSHAWRAVAVNSVSGDAERKLPPRPRNIRTRPSCIAFIVLTVSRPRSRGGLKPNSRPRSSRKSLPHVVADTHCAVSLNVAMPAHRARSGAGTPDTALQKEKVHHLLDRRNRIAMLGESHRPATNDAITSHGDVCSFPDLFTSQPAGFLNLLPHRFCAVPPGTARSPCSDFSMNARSKTRSRIPLFGSEHFQHDALDRCHITVYTNGQPKIGDFRRFPNKGWQRLERIREVLRIGEPTQPDFRQHVDADNLAASLLGSLEAA